MKTTTTSSVPSAFEDSVTVYKYSGGERTRLGSGTAKIDTGEWHELEVEVDGESIRALVNKREVVEATDDEFAAGKIGLGARAGSLSCFDNVTVTELTA